MKVGSLLGMVSGLLLGSVAYGQEAMPQPDNEVILVSGDWKMVQKGYCKDCGRGMYSPYFVDILIFAGDTIRGRGFQSISTPFGKHCWRALSLYGITGRRWTSDKGENQYPFLTPEQALAYCKPLAPAYFKKFAKLHYTPADSLKIWPWELRKVGEGWSVLRNSKPMDPGKQSVNTPWGLMRWDAHAKFWRCDKKVVPNDFR